MRNGLCRIWCWSAPLAISRWLFACAVICVLACFGLCVHMETAVAPSAPGVSLPAAAQFGFLFRAPVKEGRNFLYQFSWGHSAKNHFLDTAQIPALLGQSEIGMEGNVRLTALVPRNQYTILALEVVNLRSLGGDPRSRELFALLPHQMAGATAYLVLHPDGTLQSIRFPEATPAAFSNFVQRFVGILLHERPASEMAPETVKSENTPFGVATTKYEARGPGQVYRTRMAYTRVDGFPVGTDLESYAQEIESGGLFTFRDDGVLASFGETESLRLTKSGDLTVAIANWYGLSLSLLETREARSAEGRAAPEQLASFAVHAPWEVTLDQASERKAVEDRLEGLTTPALMAYIRAVAALGLKAPDQLKFFNRATAYLKLYPEVAASFVDLIHEPQMSYEGRAFALDILASAGNDVVQAALIKSLRDTRTRALPEYISLYQRIALVRVPSDATVGFAQETFEQLHDLTPKDETEADLRMASIFTLGSVAGHMKDTRRLEAAERICRRLVEKMNEGNGSPKSAYITALGNAGVPAEEPLLLRLTEGREKATRVAALNALRKYDTLSSRARVVGLLTAPVDLARDVDFATQAEALRALMLMTPERADIQQIAAAIVKDTLHRDLYGEVVPLFRKGSAPYSDVSTALDAMFARSAQLDNDLQTRIDTLRAELSNQP